jgi:membrane associated rhomboid family serine protease
VHDRVRLARRQARVIPIRDHNPTRRAPLMTFALLGAIAIVWIVVQGAGFDVVALASSVCNLGLVAGELTRLAPSGQAVPIAPGLACVVDREPVNVVTPVTAMFLHGGWGHLLGNALFFWVFADNVEDRLGRGRFLAFYLACGLIAAAAQIAIDPASPVPMVGASGAIAGVLAAYLRLFPSARIDMFFPPFFLLPLPAWAVIGWWFALQVLAALPQVAGVRMEEGVAVLAHLGGFVAGWLLVRPMLPRR